MNKDNIISALIGLVGACNNNQKTADTDRLILKALAFPLLCPKFDDNALQEIINEIYAEKNSVAPGCAQCVAPCGNTFDYDMSRIYTAKDGIRRTKLQIVEKLQELAAHLCRAKEYGANPDIDNTIFYKALSYVSYDTEEAVLHKILDEIEKTEQDKKSGGIPHA